MYPMYTAWIDPRPTPQRKVRKPPRPTRRPVASRGMTTFGYHRSTRGPVPQRSSSDWYADGGSGFDQLAALVYPRTPAFDASKPGAILAAKARQKAGA